MVTLRQFGITAIRHLTNRSLLRNLPFLGGALISLATGGLLYFETSQSIERDAAERFAEHARNAQGIISVRIKSYSDLLRGAASLFQSSDKVSHAQFHEYVAGLQLERNFPAVDRLTYTTHVVDENVPEFERTTRTVLDEFLGQPSNFKIKPAGRRPVYSVVTYIEPPAPPSRYGIDLMANAYVGTTIEQTRDSGKMMASGTPIAALSEPNNAYLGMRIPVYAHGASANTVEQRRATYRGSIGIAFSVPKLVQGVLDEMPLKNVRLTLFDSGPRLDLNGRDISTQRRILYDSKGTVSDPTPPLDNRTDVFTLSVPLDFNGRPWQTTFSVPKIELYSDTDRYYPIFALGAGCLASLLIYVLFYAMSSSRKRALVIAQDMTKELRESQRELEISHQNLRRLTAHAYQIKELERKRVAREIHDELGQNLLALRIDADLLSALTCSSHSRLHDRARSTVAQIDATIKSVRQIINDLRPSVLDLGLGAAVEWQAREFQQRTGIRCTLHGEHQDLPLNDHTATAFFRILQESLTNISRHAHATAVSVTLDLRGNRFLMTIKDDGRGLPPDGRHKPTSFGLVGIEERVRILGGDCEISSAPGAGTTICVSVPINNGILLSATDSQNTSDCESVII